MAASFRTERVLSGVPMDSGGVLLHFLDAVDRGPQASGPTRLDAGQMVGVPHQLGIHHLHPTGRIMRLHTHRVSAQITKGYEKI